MSVPKRFYRTAEDAAQACSAHILSSLKAALAKSEKATLAISGGSTPKLMFRHMAAAEFDWRRIYLFWVDERAVPPNHPESNYRMAEEYLIKPSAIPDSNLCRILAELEPEQAAERYEADIRRIFSSGDRKLPIFDVIHLGIGADAHTASLFPGERKIEDRSSVAAAVYAAKIPQWRITLLPGVLISAKNLAVLTAGKDKARALHQVFYSPYNPLDFPAQLIANEASSAAWFIDDAAGELIR